MRETKGEAKCRACGAPLKFIRSRNGRAIPVNAERTTIVTDSGDVVSGHVSHFATCPHAESFRKRAGGAVAGGGNHD